MAVLSWYQRNPGVGVRVIYFAIFAANGSFGVFLWPYLREQGLSGTQLGVISATGPLLLLLTQPIVGWVADRLGDYRRVLAVLALGAVGTNVLLGNATGFLPLLVAYSLWIVFHGPLIPVAETVNLTHIAHTGDSYGRARMWGAVGFTVGALLGAFLMNRIPLHGAFWLYPIWVSLLCAAALSAGGSAVRKRAATEPSGRRFTISRGLYLLMLLSFLINAAFAVHNTFFSIYLQEMNASSGLVGTAWAVAGLSEIPILFLLDRMTARWGIRNLLLFSGLAYTLRYALYVGIYSPEPVLAVQLLQGVTFPLFASAIVLATNQLVPASYRATGQTLMASVGGSLAGIVGNLGGGWLFDLTGAHTLYLALAAVALLGTAGYFLIPTTPAPRPQEPT